MRRQKRDIKCALHLCLWLFPQLLFAHGQDMVAGHKLHWQTEQIRQVSAISPFSTVEPEVKNIEGKQCLSGPFLNLDVDNDVAFDIDENLEIDIEFDLQNTPDDVVLHYDRNGGTPGTLRLSMPKQVDTRWYRHRFVLQHARFAGRVDLFHIQNGDVSISAAGAADKMVDFVTVCDISLHRREQNQEPEPYGQLSTTLVDENGNPVPARVGIYDPTGRTPLPGTDALPLRYKSLSSRSVILGPGVVWPVENRFAFYINGRYQARLPVGHYQLVASRGLEYRFVQQAFEIKPGQTTELSLQLSRWADMPEQDWYSGDVHIHVGRGSGDDDRNILAQAQAEDLHVANLLQMGDVATLGFQQYRWQRYPDVVSAPYLLVPGQEDPRSRRGHAIQLNITEPVRNPPHYYQYHQVFEAVQRQGGLTGYAHVRETYSFGAEMGLALDVPYGLVDFIEILQFSQLSLNQWFDWLNLGYRLAPAAGTDYAPLSGGVPGEVRSYVNVKEPYSVQGWFDGLKAGQSFVTNGPMLDMTVNGQGIGSDVYVQSGARLQIKARASVNPDIARLRKIELYRQGQIVAVTNATEGAEKLTLDFQTEAGSGSWFVVKATGERAMGGGGVVAVSAPVYVQVRGGDFCDLAAVPDIVKRQKAYLESLRQTSLKPEYGYEYPGEAAMREKYWPANRALLETRISEAMKEYDRLLALARKGRCVEEP